MTGPGKGGFVDVDTGEVLVAGRRGSVSTERRGDVGRRWLHALASPSVSAENQCVRMGYGRGYDIGVFGSVFGHNVTQNLPVLAFSRFSRARNFDAVFNLSQGRRRWIPQRS